MWRRAMPAKCTTCGYQPKGISNAAFMRISACGWPTLPRRSLPHATPWQQSTVCARPASIASAAHPELPEHLVGVLAEHRREPLHTARRGRQLDRRSERPDTTTPRRLALHYGAVGRDLRMREDVLEHVDPAGGDVVRLEEGDPVGARPSAEDVGEDRHDLGAVLHAQVVGREARVGQEVLAVDR